MSTNNSHNTGTCTCYTFTTYVYVHVCYTYTTCKETYSSPLKVRWQSMQHLSHFPPGDLVTCENWLPLRAALKDALGDADRRIAVSEVVAV